MSLERAIPINSRLKKAMEALFVVICAPFKFESKAFKMNQILFTN